MGDDDQGTDHLKRGLVAWPTCDVGVGSGCVGVRVGSYDRCWAHLPPEGLKQALGSLSPGMDLDVRGTTVGADLLGQILGVLSGPSGGRPRIGSARCDLAEFNGDARFDGAEFISGALFNDAKFSGSAGFEG